MGNVPIFIFYTFRLNVFGLCLKTST